MPFFWSTLAAQGQLYGNRALANQVNVSNNQWFSYPGYSEILTGYADNERIHSNDKFNNPNKNVLEFIQSQKGFDKKVAAFTSWEVFPYIINTDRNKIPVNAGLIKAQGNLSDREKLLNDLSFQLPNDEGETRLDGLTFQYAFEYLKLNRPRVLFISFDETDHFAHGGRYDRYLKSARYTDNMIATLWEWIQSQPNYKDRTTMLITTDHGRGAAEDNTWKDHGQRIPNANQIWLAVIGPDTPAKGELKTAGLLYQNQVAKTLAAFLGLNFVNDQKNEGAIIPSAGNFK
jgi:predicted AlkP superfamily pyrophosphatase or phosphodiesterase